MAPRSTRPLVLAFVAALVALAAAGVASSQTPKRGGVLNAMLVEDPPGFSIHEVATISGVWPVAPCYSNLVIFDPLKPRESRDTVMPELAEKWSWQDDYRQLVLFLRKGVKWHDGQPFSAKDVKYTFDVVREAKEAPARLRINPRKEWYGNIEAIETPDPYTVIFRLRHPQPSLLLMLASGYSPIYPAHVPPATLRTRCVGTGPFRLKQYVPGQIVEFERNADYFVADRPYLDGLRYLVIADRAHRMAALETGRLDTSVPLEMTKLMAENVRRAAPALVVTEIGQNGSDNVVINHKRPPFDDPTVRRAISLAMDRRAYVRAVRQNGAVVGVALMPPPFGVWGLPDKELRALPGYGDAARDKAEARRLLARAGHGPGTPLRLDMITRSIGIYLDLASFVVDQLHQVGVEMTLRQVETSQYFPMLTRRDYQIAANLTSGGFDDPDAYLLENFKCGSSRNYTDYCNEATDAAIDAQSAELDAKRRLALVWDVQRKLEADVARPMLGWRIEYFTRWPYVRNLVPHNALYNYARMQEVWLDK